MAVTYSQLYILNKFKINMKKLKFFGHYFRMNAVTLDINFISNLKTI